MCRMIAAVGRFDVADLARALRLMAGNANISHDHEFRARGPAFAHDCGWGTAFIRDGRLTVRRSASSALDDPRLDALDEVTTDMALLHARRTPDRASIAVSNSHPFVARYEGAVWAFCHNGTVEDKSQLTWDPRLVAGGTSDSELLFQHILTRIDPRRLEASLEQIMAPIRDYTSLNCFLATEDSITVFARSVPGTTRPRYYTLWHGSGPDLELASSEPIPWPGVTWDAVPDGSCFTLRRAP
jgi:predicted glutamine amidotransferase